MARGSGETNYGEQKVYSLDKLRFESDNMEWKPFCAKYVSMTNEVGWSDMDRLENLNKFLDYRADEYLGRIRSCDVLADQKLTWSEVNQQFEARFCSEYSAEAALSELLENSCQGSDESAEEWAHRVCGLCARALP